LLSQKLLLLVLTIYVYRIWIIYIVMGKICLYTGMSKFCFWLYKWKPTYIKKLGNVCGISFLNFGTALERNGTLSSMQKFWVSVILCICQFILTYLMSAVP
jgi:hypothetical protein